MHKQQRIDNDITKEVQSLLSSVNKEIEQIKKITEKRDGDILCLAKDVLNLLDFHENAFKTIQKNEDNSYILTTEFTVIENMKKKILSILKIISVSDRFIME